MNEDNVALLIETAERARSNSHRIDGMEERMKSYETEQKAIYKIATSVELMTQQLKHIDEKVDHTNDKLDAQNQAWKESEKRLSDRISENEAKPLRQTADNINKIKVAVITAVCTAMATGALAAIIAFMK
jgi:Fic family protein